jgi:hypothetical protein
MTMNARFAFYWCAAVAAYAFAITRGEGSEAALPAWLLYGTLTARVLEDVR